MDVHASCGSVCAWDPRWEQRLHMALGTTQWVAAVTIPSCHVLPCLVVSRHVMSCHVMSVAAILAETLQARCPG